MGFFGGAAQGLKDFQDRRRQAQQSQLDDAVKYAQLSESGYNIKQQPRGMFGGGQVVLERDPNFASLKDLQRKKLELENEKLGYQSQFFKNSGNPTTFGGGANPIGQMGDPNSPFVMDPITMKPVKNPAYVNEAGLRKKADIKQEYDLKKPLTGDTANKYSGAKQGIGNIQQILDGLGLEQDETGKVTSKKFGDVSSKLKKYMVADKMGGVGLTFQNVATGGLYGKILGANVDPEIKNLATSYKLLIENQLRARSGAAVPEQEVQREFDRTAMDFFADPQSVFNKLNEANTYLAGTANEIRPGQTPKLNTGRRFGQPQQSTNLSAMSDEELMRLAGIQ